MHLIVLLLLLSPIAFAQLNTGTGAIPFCDENTFISDPPTDPGTNTYDCVDVVITNPLTYPLNDIFNLPLTIRATGAVTVDGNILFQGADGSAGALGGPGGGSGGIFFGSGQEGQPVGQGGDFPDQPAGCNLAEEAEGSGGGGGSLITKGEDGKAGTHIVGGGTIEPPGSGGLTLYTLDLNNFISSGSGGATGEAGCLNGNTASQPSGNGGGGGGGLRIISAGDITVNGTINVSGGKGQTVTTYGGGGGGGSGGVIILQSISKINLNNSLYALGGQGGTNSLAGTGGNGGAGAPGFIMLEDLNGTRTAPGVMNPPSSPLSSKNSLNSDISCGTIGNEEDSNLSALLLMLMGFLLITVIKILSRFPLRS